MSILRDRDVACPSCDVTFNAKIAESINGGRGLQYRAAILDRSFQRYTCAQCQQRFAIDSPFTYIDFTRDLWFVLYPLDWEPRWAELEDEPRRLCRVYLAEHAPPFMKATAERMRVRSVFGLEALREKILCIEAGLDDARLEAIKLERMREAGVIDPQMRERLLAVDEASFTLGGPQAPAVRLERSALDALEGDAWAAVIDQLREGPYVDVGRLLV